MADVNPKCELLERVSKKPRGEDVAQKQVGVYERVEVGQQLHKDRDHFFLNVNNAVCCDTEVPDLKDKANRLGLFLGGSQISKVQMHLVDALYSQEPILVSRLNVALEDSTFGPYDHISEAVNQLINLGRKGKNIKAQELQNLLVQFAQWHDGDLQGIMEWPNLMNMRRQRNRFSHPLDKAYLRAELDAGNTDLSGVMGAAKILLSEGEASAHS